MNLDLAQITKYILEGLAVSAASNLIAGNKLDIKEIVLLGVTAAAVFAVLDLFAPSIVKGARQGAGFGLGYRLVSEGFTDDVEEEGEEGEKDENVDAEGLNLHIDSRKHVVNDPNQPYRLVPGTYAHRVLLAGFNENAKAANNENNALLAKWPFEDAPSPSGEIQTGGWAEAEENAKTTPPEVTKTPEAPKPTVKTPSETTPSTTPKTPVAKEQDIHDNNYRRADALYSGDLVDITHDGNPLQRGTIDSQIIFDKPLPKVNTNLSKLRFVHPNHQTTKQTVLNYAEPIYLQHNAYFNNSNQAKYIKYGDRLQSHQDGPLFRSYKVYDANNKARTGPIEPGTEVIIARGDQDGDKIFLKIEQDKSVSSKSPQNEATKFKISLKRVFELYGKNLCVCSDDVLYP